MQGLREFGQRALAAAKSSAYAIFVFSLFVCLAAPAVATAADAPSAATAERSETGLDEIFAGGAPGNVDDLRAMQAHLRQLVKSLIPSTVSVRVGPAQGSGVIISPDGYVLTAAHVVGQAQRDAYVVLTDGKRVRGETLGRNIDLDAGLIKITEENEESEDGSWPSVEMGRSAELKAGQWCLAIGHPGGFQRGRPPVLRFGRILSRRDSVLVTDCPLVGGDSGGPLFDMQGNVIGIHSRIGTALTTNLHVPVDTYRVTWDRLARGETWGGSPFIGVEGDLRVDYALISNAIPGGAAEKAGVRAGDIVKRFAGKEVTTFDSLRALVGRCAPGDRVTMVVSRGENTIELQLEVGRR